MSDEFDEDAFDFGTCCGCESVENVRNIVMLDVRGPIPGTGWGCFSCWLPADGAVAVMCDKCVENAVKPKFVVSGYVSDKKRVPFDQCSEIFEHDVKRHEPDPMSISSKFSKN